MLAEGASAVAHEEWFDVVVVGAGPAGCAAASTAARGGARVALVGDRWSTSHPELLLHLSPPALAHLTALGIDPRSGGAWPMTAGHLHLGASRVVDLWAEHTAAGVRADTLASSLEMMTSSTGVERVLGLAHRIGPLMSGGGTGVRVSLDDDRRLLRGATVIMATGNAPTTLGVAVGSERVDGATVVQAYVNDSAPSDVRFDVFLPLGEASPTAAASGHGWVHSGPDGLTVVGAGTVALEDLSPQQLVHRARAALGNLFDRIGGVERLGHPQGHEVIGFTRHDFAPDRTSRPGVLAAGDAAGLVNAFTGEGLSYALESGRAAGTAALDDGGDEKRAAYYRRELSRRFVGDLESARWGRRRHHLGWRVLAETVEDGTPFFVKARRAMLVPSGLAAIGSATYDRAVTDFAARPFLAQVDELLLAAVRDDWPFLARMLSTHDLGARLRPATVVFWSSMLGGRVHPALCDVAAAVELAALASVVGLSARRRPSPGGAFSWSQAVVVVAGDFLLAQSARRAARSGQDLAWAFAGWLEELVDQRQAALAGTAEGEDFFARILAFAARIGGHLGGAAPERLNRLNEFGDCLGRVFADVEELLALDGRVNRLEVTREVLVELRLVPSGPANPTVSHTRLTRRMTHAETLLTGLTVPGDRTERGLRRILQELTAPVGTCLKLNSDI